MNVLAVKGIQTILDIPCQTIKIVDIGASPLDGRPPYAAMLEAGLASIIGFEPNPDLLLKLNQQKRPDDVYLPYAIGDGKRHTLKRCAFPGMTSLLQPNKEVLGLFHDFETFGYVVGTDDIDTVRLDDVPEAGLLDLLKIDIQGGELMVFQNATECLKHCVLIHTEVEFLPMYVGQPLFSDVDLFLRSQGFMLHRFDSMHTRTLKPTNPYVGLNQVFWSDAIYIRDITRLNLMATEQLLRLAIILHEIYHSYDVALYLLLEYDRRSGTQCSIRYNEAIENSEAYIAFSKQSSLQNLTIT